MSLRKQAFSGLVWTFAQQFGNQIIGFFVSLVLARLLLPKEFGLIGMIAVFLAVGKSLVDSGLTQSLIRSKDLDHEDYSTVFYFNLAASFLIYLVLYFTAPFIADFYKQPMLTNIARWYCITFIISAFSAVQKARMTRNMNFKMQTVIAIPATIVGGIIGVSMAYMDYGVWSLVCSAIATALVSSIQLWIYSKWNPGLTFNFDKFKYHLGFGYKLALSGLLNTIFSNIYLLVIGRVFSASQVGFYTRAETMKQLPVKNLSNALNQVTYPMFSRIQDDDARLKRVYKQLMQMVLFIIAPVLVLLAVLAEPTFRFLFTEKWLPAVPYFQILCATGILYPIHSYNLNILKVKGRSDLFLKLEIVKKIIVVITIAVTLQFGIIALLYGQIIISIISFVINTHYTGKFIGYSAGEQVGDVFPIILLSSFVGAAVVGLDYYLKLEKHIDIIRIVSGGLFGAAFYLLLAYLLKFNSFADAKKILLKK